MNAVSKRSLTGMHRGGKATETFLSALTEACRSDPDYRRLRLNLG